MRDRDDEAAVYQRTLIDPARWGTALCVAPHPDDEVFGCGGLLACLADLGRTVHVLILSRGERAAGEPDAAMARIRVDEALRAASVLGIASPSFGDWPDRGMRYGGALVDDIHAALVSSGASVVLLPALSEPHPDHQAVALAGVAAVLRGAPSCRDVLFYEVGAPMVPNARLDLAGVAERKWAAAACYESQLALQPYLENAKALAALRAFGFPGVAAAEAYWCVDVETLRRQGPEAALPLWPLVRGRLELANAPRELPLVSVLASVAAQTYSNVEVVVVNASGRPHAPPPPLAHGLPLRMVDDASIAPAAAAATYSRPRAANQALAACRGEYALFLDDDDWLYPDHVERLLRALSLHPDAVAAYGGVRVLQPDGSWLRDYDTAWSSHRLRGINFLPVHAVLFRAEAARGADALRFDESLPVLEDWDFWRRLARRGTFVHCPGISAVYCRGESGSGVGDPSHPHYWKNLHRRLIEQDLAQVSAPTELADMLAWHAVELDTAETKIQRLLRERDDEVARAQRLLEERDRWAAQAGQFAEERDRWAAQAGQFAEERDRWAAQAGQFAEERDRWAAQAGQWAEERDRWAAQAGQFAEERDRRAAQADQLAEERDRHAGDLRQARQAYDVVRAQLDAIVQSRAWALVSSYRRLRARLGGRAAG
jgi:LmbE family N-acetylglucosaminyl deacetylase